MRNGQKGGKIIIQGTVKRSKNGGGKGGTERGSRSGPKQKGVPGNPTPGGITSRPSREMVSIPRDTKSGNAASTEQRRKVEDIRKFITQMVLPEWSADVVRSPCPVNFKNHCTKFNQVLSLVVPASGLLSGRLVPTPHNVEITNSVPVPDSPSALNAQGFVSGSTGNGAMQLFHGDLLLGTLRRILIAAVPWFPLFLSDNSTVEDQSGAISELLYSSDGFTISSLPFVLGVATLPVGRSANFIWFVGMNDTVTTQFGGVGFSSAQITPGYLFQPNPITLPTTWQTLRTTAETILVTFEGSSLANEGSLAMALTDPGWFPQSSNSNVFDLYTALSALPDKKYNGPLKKGAFGWWCPAVLDEKVPQKPEFFDAFPETSAIWFAIKGGDPGATVKIETNQIVEFYAPDQVFSHVACAGESPIYTALYAAFNNLPHVGENDAHHKDGKAIIGKLNGMVTSAMKDPIALGLGLVALA